MGQIHTLQCYLFSLEPFSSLDEPGLSFVMWKKDDMVLFLNGLFGQSLN